MPRDYKHRKVKKKDGTPGWIWGLGGLAIGLSVAVYVHLQDQRRVGRPAAPVANPAAIPSSAREDAALADEEESSSRFDFYEMLPRFEVVIPETESAVGQDGAGTGPGNDGTYVLQAGSFRTFADADRMKARLALQGLSSEIQKVTIDDRRWHRVRLGPFTDPDELQRIRRRLREADIDVLTLRVGG